MFAHCLLPALLLLAAVDFCTSKPPKLPPVVTNKFAGSNKNVDKHLKKTYKLDYQYGFVDVLKVPELTCGHGLGYTNLSLNVTVHDYKPVNITLTDVTKLKVKRATPKPPKYAVVDVDVGCGPVIP